MHGRRSRFEQLQFMFELIGALPQLAQLLLYRFNIYLLIGAKHQTRRTQNPKDQYFR
jgi:hypothetical protein